MAALTFAGCSESPTELALFNDATVTLDVAASAGDAAASMVETMAANEAAAGASAELGETAALLSAADPTTSATVVRSRTCFDVAGAVVANCLPISSVRKIATQVTLNGSRTSTSATSGGTSATWTGVVHRVTNDTTTRNFNGTTETSRTHSGVATARDTTTFTDALMTRRVAEAAVDSVKAIVFNLPRSQNPYPVSGAIVRVSTITVALSKGERSESRDLVRTIRVDFPADAQGNVVLKVNSKTCNLNLVTHVVSACV